MATVLAFYVEDGRRQLAAFELTGTPDKPTVIYDQITAGAKRASMTLPLDPTKLQATPGGKADYFYRGQIMFPTPQEN